MKIIVSLTTIPSRISYIQPVINGFMNQTLLPDEIHIQIPQYSKKEQVKYDIPDFLNEYDNVKVQLHEEDFGSACKWLYPIKYLANSKDILLIIADDDCIHNPECIEIFMQESSKQPDVSFCFSGGVLSRAPEKVMTFRVGDEPFKNALTIMENRAVNSQVDVVQGFGMFTLKPYWFETFDFSIFENTDLSNHSDDILISAMLEYLKIQRIQIAPFKSPVVQDQAEINPIHGDGRLLNLTLNGIEFMKEKLHIWKNVHCMYPSQRPLYLKIIHKVKGVVKNLLS